MSKKRLQAVTRASLPALERLEVWFGSDNYGADCNVKDLAPILQATHLPKLVHLGLKNAEFEQDIAEALPESKVASRLVSLDLSMGTMDDDGVTALCAGAKAFPRLKHLDVSENYLTAAGLKALARAFPSVTLLSKDQKELDADDPEWRYVSVAE